MSCEQHRSVSDDSTLTGALGTMIVLSVEDTENLDFVKANLPADVTATMSRSTLVTHCIALAAWSVADDITFRPGKY